MLECLTCSKQQYMYRYVSREYCLPRSIHDLVKTLFQTNTHVTRVYKRNTGAIKCWGNDVWLEQQIHHILWSCPYPMSQHASSLILTIALKLVHVVRAVVIANKRVNNLSFDSLAHSFFNCFTGRVRDMSKRFQIYLNL